MSQGSNGWVDTEVGPRNPSFRDRRDGCTSITPLLWLYSRGPYCVVARKDGSTCGRNPRVWALECAIYPRPGSAGAKIYFFQIFADCRVGCKHFDAKGIIFNYLPGRPCQ